MLNYRYIISMLVSWSNENNKRIKRIKSKNDDVCFIFENNAELWYKLHYELKYYKSFIMSFHEDATNFENILKFNLETIENDLLNGEVQRNSTSEVLNMVHIWKREIDQQMRKKILLMLKQRL